MGDFATYQRAAAETAIYPGHDDTGSWAGLAYCALGLGEAGEIQGKVKKIARDQGGDITQQARLAIAMELGDLLWYIAACCTQLDLELEAVAGINLSKLQSRKERGVIGGSGDDR